MSRILVIEDESAIRRVLVKILAEENDDYDVQEAEDGLSGIEAIKKDDFDLVLCDIKMPKMDGVEVLEAAKKIKPEVPFIMISGHGDLDTAVNTMRMGAFDYISKPPDLNRLLTTVRNALDRKELVVENKTLKKKISKNYEMVGESEQIGVIKDMIEKVAPTDARVLITGSNGTGKELVAHWLHQKSQRSSEPFIEVNCAAIPSELIESELFGHVKGAFTSAVKDRAGKFETANKGTIFLDEIGDMSLSAQAKVLRALQENKISRVGSDKDIKVDVRVLAATNKDLKKEIEQGKFREDLYHRLAVILIKVPSLNDRRDDIPLLITYFSEKIASEQGTAQKNFSQKAIELLKSYDWTGNIRELRNVVERLIILGGKEVSEEDVKLFASK
ncbi:DNA-binding transcriptional response regulator, NtrC family, contains REC, AAA-type ATPase, and a Fis-type DNA-binding domains [Flagellimonas taeanensis]|jgi:DNA-binding NtrC family response regulator|uniref:DNA-binding transcriptional response regulator, NtrC family, contains REC, AAA-type ATPase, and a Fis-type DNA-binding domains n=1 Tax=Flagellimonas taeanensis TaxID=1005926 RepID=A0A1M6RSM6_9FLAO|nr:sigma-54 dependent transcriptional regulator [Allomuricauda taeanensis]MEE1962964.1 sigma-54 dependent transcriptional regulator [Allomuricauda taeanensis]SFB76506.1 DNA-binding transcriptional response regulator, NtrC family, contains REC, AAA-type ATPase, and a Fis-type DNA-binding domains [Allomuricauda taeanensis]SHK35532.1 DNA-binding transcriptional response regulator, NtrC family, contains REC, AAA-type ATPase, and a Fis-type DNA-binding domains [Allomuricauda taeanensis]